MGSPSGSGSVPVHNVLQRPLPVLTYNHRRTVNTADGLPKVPCWSPNHSVRPEIFCMLSKTSSMIQRGVDAPAVTPIRSLPANHSASN